MDKFPDTKIIDPTNLIEISRGRSDAMLRYLNQFSELIPERIRDLKSAIVLDDRKTIRSILHKMSPQCEFFGINEVVYFKRRMEIEYASLPYDEMMIQLNKFLLKLEVAHEEVDFIIKNHF